MPSPERPHPPVVPYAQGDGWLMALIGNIKVTFVAKALDNDAFAQLAAATAKQIDDSPVTPSGVLYEVSGSGDMDARRRKVMGELLDARRDKLSRITAGYVLVTSSALVRGLLTAVFWFAPPPYPWHVAGTPEDAFEWLSRKMPGEVDVKSTVVAYEALKQNLRA